MEICFKKVKKGSQDEGMFRGSYMKYLEELNRMDESVEVKKDSIEEYLASYDVYMIIKDCMYVGFLVIGTCPFCPKDADYFIAEFCILPQYRRKKIGTLVMKKFFDDYKGRYFLYILKKNAPALMFWKEMIIKNHLSFYPIEDVYDCPDHLLYWAVTSE